MAGVLQSANEAKLASMAGAYNLGITNLDDDNEPAFTGVVEVNGAYFKFTAEAPTGVSGITASTTYYISVVVNTGVTPNTATLECEATTGYTVNQTKNGIYDATGAKRAVLQCYKSGNSYANKRILKDAAMYEGGIYSEGDIITTGDVYTQSVIVEPISNGGGTTGNSGSTAMTCPDLALGELYSLHSTSTSSKTFILPATPSTAKYEVIVYNDEASYGCAVYKVQNAGEYVLNGYTFVCSILIKRIY